MFEYNLKQCYFNFIFVSEEFGIGQQLIINTGSMLARACVVPLVCCACILHCNKAAVQYTNILHFLSGIAA